MTSIKTVVINLPRIENALDIEDILCLSTLIANGELAPDATLDQSRNFFANKAEENCGNCPFNLTCLACIINE